MNSTVMRIELRAWKVGDLPILIEFANNERIAANMTDSFPHPYSKEAGLKFIEWATSSDPNHILCIKADGKVCGSIGLHAQQDVMCKNMELGYWIAEPYWGQGIATNAVTLMVQYGFKHWDINRIFAKPFAVNIGSLRVLEKVGFRKEGLFKAAVYKRGRYIDFLEYAIHRTEWEHRTIEPIP